jgi:hypothetical protein
MLGAHGGGILGSLTMSRKGTKQGNQDEPGWEPRAQEGSAEDSARRFPAGDVSRRNHTYYFTAFPLTSSKFSPMLVRLGKSLRRRTEIFWQRARLSEYSAKGLERMGCCTWKAGLPGKGIMNTSWVLLPVVAIITMAGSAPGRPAAIKSGEALVKEMHERYAASWYPTVTFTQKSTTYNPDGTTKVETWYEAALLPGKLRIDIGPPSEGNGYLLVDGNVTVFKEGHVKANVPQVNMLLVLGFDVYKQTPEATLAIAKKEGFDAGKFHEDTWEGKPVYVFGAEKGDLKSKQFWVEKDRMLFVRLLEPDRSDPNKTQDIRFADYRKLGGGWIAALVEVYLDGKKVFSEEYTEIKSGVKLDPAVFDPKQFTSAHWEKP